jgi:hypothetical protein
VKDKKACVRVATARDDPRFIFALLQASSFSSFVIQLVAKGNLLANNMTRATF